MIDRVRRLPTPAIVALSTFVVALPLVVAVVALAQRRWYPVLDLAMTELRVRDVGSRRIPLIGLPGRIGETIPEQGSHPGPSSFWALAPGYRIFGSSAWALEAATVSIALVWIAMALWIGHRRLGVRGVALVAAVIAVAVRGFGLSVLTQPWNPYMPLLAWLVVLLATWGVMCGDDILLIPLAVAASFAAGTHIPYLLMAGGLGVFAVGWVLVSWYRSRDDGASRRPTTSLLVTSGVFAALWLAPVVDQIRNGSNGNLSRLLEHFGSPPEEAIGFGAGLRLMLRHLDVATGFVPLLTGQERFLQASSDSDGPIWSGILLLMLFVGSFVVAVRLRHPSLVRLHALLAVTLVLTFVSMSRIFGVRWFYLTLWAWITTTLVLVAIGWTTATWLRRNRPDVGRALTPSRLATGGVALAVVATVSMVAVAPSTDHPEEYLSEPLGEVLGPTISALDPGEGYVVQFRDASAFGSQAFGLVSELERAGFDAGMQEFWTVPITSSRTKPVDGDDRELQLVTGGFIDEWRSMPGFAEVAFADTRSTAERAEYEALRTDLIDDLLLTGLDDLVDPVDTNLFAVTVDPRISAVAQEISAEMILFPQPVAVFLAAPATGS